MKRFACVAAVCLVSILGIGASSAYAQTAAGADSKMYAEFNGGPTLGHKSSGFFGGEFGFRLTEGLEVYVEGTHMNNVGTSQLDADAALIANYLGGTAATAYVANGGDAGLKYTYVASPMIHPYVLAGFGVTQVRTEVEFSVNGNVVNPLPPTVQLGSNLSGSTTRGIFVIGFGVNVPFKQHFFADLGYRFGEIFSKSTDDGSDKLPSIPTQRIILGAGVRF
jgi:opacity protein-like surface antigen